MCWIARFKASTEAAVSLWAGSLSEYPWPFCLCCRKFLLSLFCATPRRRRRRRVEYALKTRKASRSKELLTETLWQR